MGRTHEENVAGYMRTIMPPTEKVLTFRFDDISVNSKMEEVNDIAFYLKSRFPDCRIIYGISPIVHDMSRLYDENQQRVFPKIFTAYSDHEIFFSGDKCGIPEIPDYVERASHGLVHVNHRLLSRDAQYMSISTSCSLTHSKIFIPPFNKWNKDTLDICEELRITLIQFETKLGPYGHPQWLSMEHEKYHPDGKLWYLHHWAFGLDKVKAWLKS